MTTDLNTDADDAGVAAEERDDLRQVRRYWNENPLFAGESKHMPGTREFYEEHERVLLYEHCGSFDSIFVKDAVPGARVADVGCGIGFWTHEFHRRGAVISASDLSDEAVELTRRRAKIYGIPADVRRANAESLPYEDATFDHVSAQAVIHYTPYPQRCIEEFHRILKPGGTLCFSVHYKVLFLRSRALFRLMVWLSKPFFSMRGRGREEMLMASTPEDLVRRFDGADNPMARAFALPELRSMLAAGGFEILEVSRCALARRAMPIDPGARLHKFLSRRFGIEIVLRCRKPASR